YANNRDEAAEVMNQGFYKVFTRIETFDRTRPFKAWLGRIMMNVSIDYYRANLKMAYTDDLDKAEHLSDGDLTDQKLNYDDLLRLVQKLPPAYRTVFNLFAVEGYTHEEIGELLHISPGTSKSNLHKARQKLKQWISDANSSSSNGNFNNGMDYSPIVALKKANVQGVYFDKNIGQ
ncbi:MAG: RNA polymerase sigma factor, partial [Mucilaginibacter sp.]